MTWPVDEEMLIWLLQKPLKREDHLLQYVIQLMDSIFWLLGNQKNVCIYNVAEQMLVKKFEITQNRSFDGVDELVNRRNMTEFGNLALIEERMEDDLPTPLSLPGVKKGDMAARTYKPEVSVSSIIFSPTDRMWAATTTEGLLVYSLDLTAIFDPFELEEEITPATIRRNIAEKQFSTALLQATKLNEKNLLIETLESIPIAEIGFVCKSLSPKYVERIIGFLGSQLEATRHLEYYLMWIETMLTSHGSVLKSNSMSLMAVFHLVQKNLTMRYLDLRKVCEHNKYSLAYITALGNFKRKCTNEDDD